MLWNRTRKNERMETISSMNSEKACHAMASSELTSPVNASISL